MVQNAFCQSCAAKFYDLEKDPIKCPKCGTQFDPEVALKPLNAAEKRQQPPKNRKNLMRLRLIWMMTQLRKMMKKTAEEADLRDDIEIEDDADEHLKDEDEVLIDLDDDADNDIIDDSDTKADKE